MEKTLIIGASGQIGKMTVKLLQDNNKPVVAMVRNMEKVIDLAGPGVEIVQGDLENNFESAFKGCEQVIFTAGSGAATGLDKTLLIDLWGASKAMDMAKKNKIRHFIMVSSRGADDPDTGPVVIKPYLVAKHFADNYLKNSGLDYTILRPGRLTDESGSGLIKTARPSNPEEQFISRADTAGVVYHCLLNSKAIGKTYELFKGETSIDEALFPEA